MMKNFAVAGFLPLIFAFVHPPVFVTGQWIDQTKKAKTLYVKQETTLIDPALPGGSTAVEEEIWIRKPTFFRKTAKFPKGIIHWVLTPSRAVRISGGKIENILPLDVYGAVGLFFLPDGTRRFSHMLSQAGVAADSTHWAMKDRRVLYQMGAPEGDKLFFAKDDWVPAGYQTKTKDYRLSVLLPSRFPVPFPDMSEVTVDGKIVETTRVKSVKENLSLSDAVFDINALKNAQAQK